MDICSGSLKKKKILIISFAALLAVVACNKELIPESEPQENADAGTVTLTAVIDDDLTRTYLDSDNYVCWADGDEVWINGSTYTVSVSGNIATISGVTTADQYACVYPASAATGFTDGCKVKVALSRDLAITFDGSGRQVLSLPMAAYGGGTTPLKFRNLCGLVGVTVSNTDKDAGLTLTDMKISTFGDVDFIAPLCGETWAPRDLSSGNYAEDWAVLASNIGGKDSSEKRFLNISFPENYTVAKNASTTIYIPVPVIDQGTASNISVSINASVSGNSNKFTYRNFTSGTKTIGRNQFGRIPAPSTEFYELKPSGSEWNGSGTQADPYQISNTDQFHRFTKMVREGQADGKYFRQVCDISFAGKDVIPAGIVGKNSGIELDRPFSGVYDGGRFKLSSFKLANPEDDHYEYYSSVALFPHIKGGTVKNLSVETSLSISKDVFSNSLGKVYYVAAVAGNVTDGGTLSNVTYKGTLSHDYPVIEAIGGIVGSITNTSGSISDLVLNGTVKAGVESTYVGGIAGYCKVANISNCSAASASVIELGTNEYAGGLFGKVIGYSTFGHCSFAGNIRLMEDLAFVPQISDVGGICGSMSGAAKSVLSDIQTISGSSMVLDGINGFASTYGKDMTIAVGGIAGLLYMVSQPTGDIITNRMSVTLTTADGNAKNTYVGGIAGDFDAKGSVQMQNDANITVTDNFHDVWVGGIAGYLYYDYAHTTEPYKMINNGAITLTAGYDEAAAGGIFGYFETRFDNEDHNHNTDLSFDNSLNTGNVTVTNSADDYTCAGGLAGWVDGSIMSMTSGMNFTNKGDISASGINEVFSGGVVGLFKKNRSTPMKYFSNEGKVSAVSTGKYAYAGGMVGCFIPNSVGFSKKIIDIFRNSGAVESKGTYEAFSGGVVGYDYDGAYPVIVQVFNSENTGEISSESTAGVACSGGILGYHDSNGATDVAPCVINCCNIGNLNAYSAEGKYEYAGGIIGYCYDDWTEVGSCYSSCRMGGYSSDRTLKCGGLSGTKCYEYNSYWDIEATGALYLYPTYSWQNGESDLGTVKWTELENGPADLNALVQRLNDGQASEPYYKDYVTVPSLLPWEVRDGQPRLRY